jgi:hypothetical protein
VRGMWEKSKGKEFLSLGASKLNFVDCLPDVHFASHCGDHRGDDGGGQREKLTSISLTVAVLCCGTWK